jgi:hypothetical protein
MASDPQDRLARALDELRRDVAHVPLASPASVRARGDVRTRRNRTALGAGAALTVAAIALAGSALPGVLRTDGPTPAPPAGPTSTTRPTASATPSPTATATGPRKAVDLTPVGVGHVPAAYFLPGQEWTGPDLVGGARVRSIEPKEFEGSVQRFSCDPDTALTGNVAFLQAVQPSGTIVGTQKVRLLATPQKAAATWTQLVTALPGCQDRLRAQALKDAGPLAPGETAPTPTADVTEDATARVDDATGSVRVFRTVTDYGTGAGSRLVEWVAVVREGAAVTLIDLNDFEDGDASFGALGRIATKARGQLAWAAARP